jgi:lipopolysaccharide/colanic/teichoic acid biosynthesis glycosyltransferase
MPSFASIYAQLVKPLGDRLLAATLLCALLPLLATIAVVVRLKLGSPVLFRQQRPGLGGRPFELIKFRTMLDARDAHGQLLDDAERLTRVGRWLRSTSLDELPELWNIVRGDMSFVGPRPLLVDYLPLYSPRQHRRHEVRPGITGWAQVNGRNSLSWSERFELDVWYVEHVSARVDAMILLRTAAVVLTRKGVSANNHATMPAFEGNRASDNLDAEMRRAA